MTWDLIVLPADTCPETGHDVGRFICYTGFPTYQDALDALGDTGIERGYFAMAIVVRSDCSALLKGIERLGAADHFVYQPDQGELNVWYIEPGTHVSAPEMLTYEVPGE